VLDPAGYGTLIINKSISIQGHGWGELVGAGGASAVTINAGPNDSVSLHGVILEGFGSGNLGVMFNAGRSLIIENSVIRDFATNGVGYFPLALSNLVMTHTKLINNGGNGIFIRPAIPNAASILVVRAHFKDVEIYNTEETESWSMEAK
jgi:hypothetical protein